MYFCSVLHSGLKYYRAHSKCGGRSQATSPTVTHFNRHTTHREPSAVAKQHEGSSLFSIPIAYWRLSDISFKQSKALAFLCLVRAHEQDNNCRCSYTVNSLHKLTGVHAKTIEDRLLTLEKMELIGYDEKHRIVIRSAKAKHREHNTAITVQLSKNTLKEAEKALLAARVVNKLKQINFHRDALNRYHEIKDAKHPQKGMLEEFKKLKRWLREHCKWNYEEKRFVDYGWSFKKIAEYLGTSIMKAFEIIKYAVSQGLITKTKRRKVTKIYEFSCTDDIEHSFIYNGLMFKIYANSYCLDLAGII